MPLTRHSSQKPFWAIYAPQTKDREVTLPSGKQARTEDIIVPPGKVWYLLGVQATNNDNQTRAVTMYVYKDSTKAVRVHKLGETDRSALQTQVYPSSARAVSADVKYGRQTEQHPMLVLNEGNDVEVTWEAPTVDSSGSYNAHGLTWTYIEVPKG